MFDKAKGLLRNLKQSSTAAQPSSTVLSNGDIASGLRKALRVGTERVVGQLGSNDGFNADPEVHIPLPDTLAKVKSVLGKVGMAGFANDLELRLNRAAETEAPEAKAVFWQAIQDLSLDEVRRIYEGPKDAATEYFRSKMSAPLADRMKPIVETSLSEVGAVQSYDRMIGQYKSLPLVPDVKSNLTQHVLKLALDGMFLYLAREEAAIRENPVKRTTALLQKVFDAS